MQQEPDFIVIYSSSEDAEKVSEQIPNSNISENVLYIPNGDPIAIQEAGNLEEIESSTYQISQMESEQ